VDRYLCMLTWLRPPLRLLKGQEVDDGGGERYIRLR
jgi:hypothetical protein